MTHINSFFEAVGSHAGANVLEHRKVLTIAQCYVSRSKAFVVFPFKLGAVVFLKKFNPENQTSIEKNDSVKRSSHLQQNQEDYKM